MEWVLLGCAIVAVVIVYCISRNNSIAKGEEDIIPITPAPPVFDDPPLPPVNETIFDQVEDEIDDGGIVEEIIVGEIIEEVIEEAIFGGDETSPPIVMPEPDLKDFGHGPGQAVVPEVVEEEKKPEPPPAPPAEVNESSSFDYGSDDSGGDDGGSDD